MNKAESSLLVSVSQSGEMEEQVLEELQVDDWEGIDAAKPLENDTSSQSDSNDETDTGLEISIDETNVAPFVLPPQRRIPLKNQTSNAVLRFKDLSRSDYLDLLKKKEQNDVHAPLISRYFEILKLGYSQWVFEIGSGFNLLFYGYGSKIKLLTNFVDQCLSKGSFF